MTRAHEAFGQAHFSETFLQKPLDIGTLRRQPEKFWHRYAKIPRNASKLLRVKGSKFARSGEARRKVSCPSYKTANKRASD
jgi:hypothetical protein